MRYSTGLFGIILILSAILGLEFIDSQQKRLDYHENIWKRKRLQKVVGLTDLTITSAARYLRHYSINDMTTAFQDYPVSVDHFPAGFAFSTPDYSNMPKIITYGVLPLINPVEKRILPGSKKQ